MRRNLWVAILWIGLVGLALASTAGTVFAQESIEEYAESEPSGDQVRLNQAAVEAIVAEDFEKAAKLLESSLELGEHNVTWLNLGRAYQKLGRCKDAKNAYLSAVSAPAVKEPSPKLVNAKAEQYLEEVEESCEESKKLAAADEADEANGADEASEADEGDQKSVEPVTETGGANVAGWASTITGGALLGTSAVFYMLGRSEHRVVTDAIHSSDGTVDQINRSEAIERQERGDTFKTLALSTAIAGAAATGLGVYLFVSDDSEPQVSLGTDGNSWSVSFSAQF
ncbi:MAG: tetratricopeptide repeat protein [Persicimonas sp.]